MTLKPLLAVLLAAAAMPVAAQNAPAPGAPPMAMRHHDPAMMRAMMQRMRQRHADDMALLLDLKPAQRPALDAFLAASHPGGDERMDMPMEGAPPPAGSAPPSFTDHLDHEQALLTHRAEAGQRRIAAARAFYQGLDAHQRQLFEALMRLHHAGGHGGMGGPMGGHPGHDGPGPMGGPEAPRD